MAKFVKLENAMKHDVYINLDMISEIEVTSTGQYCISVNFGDTINYYYTKCDDTIDRLTKYIKSNEL